MRRLEHKTFFEVREIYSIAVFDLEPTNLFDPNAVKVVLEDIYVF
jgi:hypothetical protein